MQVRSIKTSKRASVLVTRLLVVGLALAGFFGLAWIIGLSLGMPPGPIVVGCEGFLIFLGVMAIIFGIRSLIKASEK